MFLLDQLLNLNLVRLHFTIQYYLDLDYRSTQYLFNLEFVFVQHYYLKRFNQRSIRQIIIRFKKVKLKLFFLVLMNFKLMVVHLLYYFDLLQLILDYDQKLLSYLDLLQYYFKVNYLVHVLKIRMVD